MESDDEETPTPEQLKLPGGRRLKSKPPADRKWRSAETRNRLLNAALALFMKENYPRVSIEDIAKRAGLSRAAFYLHYSSKDEILIDFVRRSAAELDYYYRGFKPSEIPSKDRIREFIITSIDVRHRYRKLLALYFQAASLNTEIYRIFALNRDRHIAVLGENLSAFRDMGRGPEIERRRRAKAKLLIWQVEQMTTYEAFIPAAGDLEAEVDALTDAFDAFVHEYNA